MQLGLIVDFETTGLEKTDAPTELGWFVFEYGKDYAMRFLEQGSMLFSHIKPIPQEIIALTGIQNEYVTFSKKHFLEHEGYKNFNRWLFESDTVIAHNLEFDYPHLRQIADEHSLAKRSFACTKSMIDWRAKGFKTTSLNYLCADLGFVNPFPHRAAFDCAMVYQLIAKTNTLKELLENANKPTYRLLANKAPFHFKDKLKELGFYWNPELKVWYKDYIDEHDKVVKSEDFLTIVKFCVPVIERLDRAWDKV